MISADFKTAVAGTVLTCGILAGLITISGKSDRIVYFFQETLERPHYVWDVQAQPDDVDGGSGTVSTQALIGPIL